MVYRCVNIAPLLIATLIILVLVPVHDGEESGKETHRLADSILVPGRPENMTYFEPGYLLDMEIDTRTNIGYFGCLNGVVIKNLSTGDHQFISQYEGLSNPMVELLELDEMNSRLFIRVYDSFDIYELDITTNEISKIYQFDDRGTMVKASEIRVLYYESEKNILYIGSCAGLTELFLTSGDYNFYDILFFNVGFSRFDEVNGSLEFETDEYFSIEDLDYNPATNELYIATPLGLTIFNTESKTFNNFRDGSMLAGKLKDVCYVHELGRLFMGGDILVRYDPDTGDIFEYQPAETDSGEVVPIIDIEYDSDNVLLYTSNRYYDLLIYDPREKENATSDQSDGHYLKNILIRNLFPRIQYNYYDGLLYLGLGELRDLECKWRIQYDLTTVNSKKKIKNLDSFRIEPNKIADFIELRNGSYGGSRDVDRTAFTYDYHTGCFYNISLTDIPLKARELYDLKLHPETGYLFLSTYHHFGIFDHDASLLKVIDTNTGSGFEHDRYYDIELVDDLAYISTSSGIKVVNIDDLELYDFRINNSTVNGSIEVGKKTGKMYIAYDKNITIYDRSTGETEKIFVNVSTGEFTIDKNEEIAFVGNRYQVHKIYLNNYTVELYREDYCLIDIDYHVSSDTFFFRYTNAKLITTNDSLLAHLPVTESISSMYIDQSNDVLYLLGGTEWCAGGGGGSIPGALRGLIIYDMNTQSWVNYNVFYKLPLGDKSGIAYDPDRSIIHFVGEFSLTSMNESILADDPVKKQIQIIEIGPVESDELKNGINVLPVLYFGVFSIGIVFLIGFLIALEPTKYKLMASFAVPYYTRLKKEKLLDHKTRGRISGMIDIEPGIHYNELKKRLKLNNGTLSYHLQVLEREEQIKSKNSGKYKYFFPSDMVMPKKIFKMNDVQKLIFKKINEMPGISQKEIAEEIGSSTSTVNYNIKKMVEKGIVNVDKNGNETKCYIVTIDGRIEKS